MRVVPNEVTYNAEPESAGVEAIRELLEGTRVQVLEPQKGYGVRLQFPPPPYETHGYVENGKTVRLWDNDWVVVSSLLEVRKLSHEEFTREFSIETFEPKGY